MTNEKLIEEAARAIAAFTDPEAWTAFRGEAEAALAVFEKAHTQTDDEREALEAALSYLDDLIRDRQIWYDDYSSLHDLVSSALSAADFRRTEVPEPSDDPSCICPNTLGWHTTECVASRPEPETAEAQAYSKGFTEGSDQAHRDMQGEPSEAQVLAALNALMPYAKAGSVDEFDMDIYERMRAALRASWEVR